MVQIKNICKKYESDKIMFLGWLDEKDLVSILHDADLALVSLNSVGRQKLILPGKVQTYLNMGIPMLTINTGASNDLVEKYSLGISIKITKANDIKNHLNINLKNLIKNIFLRIIASKFYTKNFDVKHVVKQYLDAI